ncbi:MAG TPA: class I SAM-dependent methyltransferase [Candidatus Acidoferrales bacterium]|nr:class I SAM-dependent methyltransferase [Candidatus Acidoferrales bacterium]
MWKGDFAAHMLRSAPSISRYYMLDPWRPLDRWNKPLNTTAEDLERAYREALQGTAFAADKIKVLRGTTTEVIDQIPNESLDLIYVDGDHTLRGIATDLICVYPKLKLGAYLGGDDFEPSIWHHGPKFEPTLVFPFVVYFAGAVGAELWALDHQQFIMQKPLGGRHFQFHNPRGIYAQTELLPLIPFPHQPNIIRRIVNKLQHPLNRAGTLGR